MEFKHFKQLLQFSKESWLSNILAKSAKKLILGYTVLIVN
jgi:hypothetical protein